MVFITKIRVMLFFIVGSQIVALRRDLVAC